MTVQGQGHGEQTQLRAVLKVPLSSLTRWRNIIRPEGHIRCRIVVETQRQRLGGSVQVAARANVVVVTSNLSCRSDAGAWERFRGSVVTVFRWGGDVNAAQVGLWIAVGVRENALFHVSVSFRSLYGLPVLASGNSPLIVSAIQVIDWF